jgi:hypothetical protein
MPTRITTSHTVELMTPDMRPQDPTMDGSGLTFETLEHGGAVPDTMPQAIKVTDAAGRWCVYVPTTVDGEIVRSQGHSFTSEEYPRVVEPDGNR